MPLRFGALNGCIKNYSVLSESASNGVGINQARRPREAIVKSEEHHYDGYQTIKPTFIYTL